MGFSRIVTPYSSSQKKRQSWQVENVLQGRRKFQLVVLSSSCVIMYINCGLVDKLPTKQTRSGPKLIKPKRTTNVDRRTKYWAKPFDIDEREIILDDEDDDIFEWSNLFHYTISDTAIFNQEIHRCDAGCCTIKFLSESFQRLGIGCLPPSPTVVHLGSHPTSSCG